MNFIKKVTKLSKELGKSAEKTFKVGKNKADKLIKEYKIKEKVTKLSKQVGDFAEKTYDTAKDKSIDIINETKLKLNCNDNMKEINKIYEDIGMSIYETYKKEGKVENKFLKLCKKIDQINKENLAMEDKDLTLKNLKKCDKCSEIIKLDDNFCIVCGTEQKPIKTEIDKTLKKEKSTSAKKTANKTTKKTTENNKKKIVAKKKPTSKKTKKSKNV